MTKNNMVFQLMAVGVLQKLIYPRLPKGQISWSIPNFASITMPYSPTFTLMLLTLLLTIPFRDWLAIIIILEIYRPSVGEIVLTYRDQKIDVNRFFYVSLIICLYSYTGPTLIEILVVLLLGYDVQPKSDWLKKLMPLK